MTRSTRFGELLKPAWAKPLNQEQWNDYTAFIEARDDRDAKAVASQLTA